MPVPIAGCWMCQETIPARKAVGAKKAYRDAKHASATRATEEKLTRARGPSSPDTVQRRWMKYPAAEKRYKGGGGEEEVAKRKRA